MKSCMVPNTSYVPSSAVGQYEVKKSKQRRCEAAAVLSGAPSHCVRELGMESARQTLEYIYRATTADDQ